MVRRYGERNGNRVSRDGIPFAAVTAVESGLPGRSGKPGETFWTAIRNGGCDVARGRNLLLIPSRVVPTSLRETAFSSLARGSR